MTLPSMLATNLLIIRDLKQFLFSVSTNKRHLQQFSLQSKAFKRRRILTFERMAVFMVQLCKKTLKVELDDFFDSINLVSCTKAAFCMQRINFDPAFFYCWNRVLCESFYKHCQSEVKRWRGFRLIGCDGSNVALIRKPALEKFFGGQSNQEGSFVQAKTFYATDILNNLILYPQMVPYRYGELPAAYDMLTQINFPSDMLLIFDRNFSNYKIIALLTMREQPLKYVIRAKDSLNIVRDFLKTGKREQIAEMKPTQTIRQGLKRCGFIISPEQSIKTRLIKVELKNGTVEVLMTNLLKEEGYLHREFKELYSKRWGVETNIGFQKNILRLEALSGHSPISVLQDFYATVFTANLHSILIRPAQREIEKETSKSKYPLKVNNNLSFGKLKKVIAQIFLSRKIKKLLHDLHQYFIRDPLPIRVGRCFPRIRKNPLSKNKHRYYTNYKPAF